MNDTKSPNITVYSSPTCAFCHMAMAYLASKKIPFKEIDVSQDMDAARWVQDKLGYVATPVIDIDGEVVLGFDRPRIDQILKI
ncbi:MAG TPA: glutaredoxin family protein [Candidatus Saccharimonadales bacterium]|nr:glutaredoxin family protein [Candidatus Saccharimonadales bacterium]